MPDSVEDQIRHFNKLRATMLYPAHKQQKKLRADKLIPCNKSKRYVFFDAAGLKILWSKCAWTESKERVNRIHYFLRTDGRYRKVNRAQVFRALKDLVEPGTDMCIEPYTIEKVFTTLNYGTPTSKILLRGNDSSRAFLKLWFSDKNMYALDEQYEGLQYEISVYRHIASHFSNGDTVDLDMKPYFVHHIADCEIPHSFFLNMYIREVSLEKNYTLLKTSLWKSLSESLEEPDLKLCKDRLSERGTRITELPLQTLLTTYDATSRNIGEFCLDSSIPIDEKIITILQTVKVINYLHKHIGVYHLDLSPDNIMVRNKPFEYNKELKGMHSPLCFDWDRSQIYKMRSDLNTNSFAFYYFENICEYFDIDSNHDPSNLRTLQAVFQSEHVHDTIDKLHLIHFIWHYILKSFDPVATSRDLPTIIDPTFRYNQWSKLIQSTTDCYEFIESSLILFVSGKIRWSQCDEIDVETLSEYLINETRTKQK